MKLAICVATMKEPAFEPGDTPTLMKTATTYPTIYTRCNTPKSNYGVVGSYEQICTTMISDEDILMFVHDDVIMKEQGWDERVLKEFEDPEVGVVGFGGALWHGVPHLYKVPYHLPNLIRGSYLSNVDDAEVHGERFTGACDVAVLDGFALVVRRSLLDRAGGWRRMCSGCDFFAYDYALCATARRLGYRVRCVGIRCHHRGGGTSVGQTVQEITSQAAYDASHRWFYDNFRDVMPYDVRHEKAKGLLHNAT